MKSITKKLFAGFVALSASLFTASPALADTSHQDEKYLTLTLIGDSYTAGNGAGQYYGPAEAYRSMRNWGHVYADKLNAQGVHTTVHNLAESGQVTQGVLDNQISKVPSDSDIVLFTVGGNDIDFQSIITGCFGGTWIGNSSYDNCSAALKHAQDLLPQTFANVETILEQLSAKLSPDAQIVMVGYPLLSTEGEYILDNSGWFSSATKSIDAAHGVRQFGLDAVALQEDLTQKWNQNVAHPHLTFIPTHALFAGHEPNPYFIQYNPQRWFNEMAEENGYVNDEGKVVSTTSTTTLMFYHPNITGHSEIGKYLYNQIGVPASARDKQSYARPIDVTFLVEASSQTKAKLPEIKKQIRRIAVETFDASANANQKARFSLKSFVGEDPISDEQAQPDADLPEVPQPDASSPVEPVTPDLPEAPQPEAVADESAENAAPTDPETATDDTEPAEPTSEPEAAKPADTETPIADAPETPEGPAATTSFGELSNVLDSLNDLDTTSNQNAEDFLTTLKEVTTSSEWREEARKIVVVIGDAETGQNSESLSQSVEQLLLSAFAANTVEFNLIDLDTDRTEPLPSLFTRTGGRMQVLGDLRPLILETPTAKLGQVTTQKVGTTVEFSADGSVSPNSDIMSYGWDFNGDGQPDNTTKENKISHTFTTVGEHTVSVTVTDADNQTAIATIIVDVTEDGDLVDQSVDNCPDIANEDQLDTDNDGIGDACDDLNLVEIQKKVIAGAEAQGFDIHSVLPGATDITLTLETATPQSWNVTLKDSVLSYAATDKAEGGETASAMLTMKVPAGTTFKRSTPETKDMTVRLRLTATKIIPAMKLTPGKQTIPAMELTPGKQTIPAMELTPGKQTIPAMKLTPGKQTIPAMSLTPATKLPQNPKVVDHTTGDVLAHTGTSVGAIALLAMVLLSSGMVLSIRKES